VLVNYPQWCDRAEIIWQGNQPSQFLRGLVDKYSWVDMAHPYLPSEINAAFLWAQRISRRHHQKRIDIWQQYHQAFASLAQGKVRRLIIPDACQHNAHIYLSALAQLRRP